jgi:hypothetical protein
MESGANREAQIANAFDAHHRAPDRPRRSVECGQEAIARESHAEFARPFAEITTGRIAQSVKTAVTAILRASEEKHHLFDGRLLYYSKMVGGTGLEPVTSCL